MIKQGRLDKPYKGVVDCASRVLKTEGVYPFWRGNLANVLRYFPTQALNFAFKDGIKAMFATPKDASSQRKFATNIASGGAAGTMSLLFVYSLDYARTRLANDAKGKGGERQFNGLVDVYVKTLKADGIQGLYRGFAISAVGIFIYRGLYFGLYDTLKPLLLGPDAGVGISFLLGWAVTVTAGLMSYPIDTVRRRMMMTSGGSGVKYNGSMDCFMQVCRNEGFMSLIREQELTSSGELLEPVSWLDSTNSRTSTLNTEQARHRYHPQLFSLFCTVRLNNNNTGVLCI